MIAYIQKINFYNFSAKISFEQIIKKTKVWFKNFETNNISQHYLTSLKKFEKMCAISIREIQSN
jgi:predicted house-cleaning NTP pyrophosphatase (Maf/HAM1 superfamily)